MSRFLHFFYFQEESQGIETHTVTPKQSTEMT